MIAGALLLTPGFLTDTVGFVFLVPPWRQRVVRWFLNHKGWQIHTGGGGTQGRVIEGEYSEEED